MRIKKHIKQTQAQAGQILAADVRDSQGNCLMAADGVLDTAILRRLQERGIEILTVWEEQSLSKTEITEHRAAIKTRLAHRFRQMQDNPNMNRLYDILLAYRMESFEEQGTPVNACVDNGGNQE